MAITTNYAEEWLEEDKLMLLQCWCRDGYTFEDIANKIGIDRQTLTKWRKKYPDIENALKQGREIVDYKVENALLKSALGYHTKEVKVTTVMRYGKVVETTKEVLDKEQSPNVSAIQCWLYNRLPDKWKKNRDQLFDLNEEDSNIQVTITRASNNESHQKPEKKKAAETEQEVDTEWQEEINNSVTVRSMTDGEKKEKQKAKEEQSKAEAKVNTKVVAEPTDDLDYWPDDWEEE